MSKVNVTNILISDQAEPFLENIKLEVFIDTLEPLPLPVEWKVIYVGCAEDSSYDQILGSQLLNLDKIGDSSFQWIVDSPNPQLIPTLDDLLGASALMICAFYKNQEFFRCSYFVYNNYKQDV